MTEKRLINVEENIKQIKHEINEAILKFNRNPDDVRLMAVTKTVPASIVNHAISCGIDLLGENRAQELEEKFNDYSKENTEIHFIGHLQRNKVSKIIDKVTMIHSVDNLKLANEINKHAKEKNKIMPVLIEVNIGGEESKNGMSPQNVPNFIIEISSLSNISIRGLMTIPPICANELQNERYFYNMRQLLVDMSDKKIDNVRMDILSMGMSGDYIAAIKHGSNIIRIGTAIFGER